MLTPLFYSFYDILLYQIFTLHLYLNLHNVICLLYLNKPLTEKIQSEKMDREVSGK